MRGYQFIDQKGTFTIQNPGKVSGLYFPIASEAGLKSSVTPNFGGDAKLDQNHFLLEPVSVSDLHDSRSGRNFWLNFESGESWSVTGSSAREESRHFLNEEETTLTAGLLFQSVKRTSRDLPVASTITIFAPVKEKTEVMMVKIENTGTKPIRFHATAAIPIYGRSAANIRDHRHVTSMLHRILTTEDGVLVKPTLSFDERGHLKNDTTYYVIGAEDDGTAPVSFFPLQDAYLGEGGTFLRPETIALNKTGVPKGQEYNGQEAMGGIRFGDCTLNSGESKTYLIFIGACADQKEDTKDTVWKTGIDETKRILDNYGSGEKAAAELEATKAYWQNQVNVSYHTGNPEEEGFLRWVSVQPILRRIYGCSFLPHHDYGKGGRGWRDLWQDCLALLLMNPDGVRDMIISNFAGVRMDGTNATIIGDKPGSFLADRNNIVRVWMDHGFWPYLTVQLYLNQTGDYSILSEQQTYFKDAQVFRGTQKDELWNEDEGNKQKTVENEIYMGSVLEHLLLQNLSVLSDVGEHGMLRLRGADWNDALDLAEERGESVAFTCAYAGNLKNLAQTLQVYSQKTGETKISLAEEMLLLLSESTLTSEEYKKIGAEFDERVRHHVSGKKIEIQIEELSVLLKRKSEELMYRINESQIVGDFAGHRWMNSYYDNHGRMVEGEFDEVRMMLTGQVFAIMSGTADEELTGEIIKAADRYLYSEEAGGYRLNTDFHEVKTDMGRMFGFAYGEKENGAVFSHMTVMYAYSLYSRGFAEEGRRVLRSLEKAASDFEKSKIYPGIPEYFNASARGLYHYLTGAASWLMLTEITQSFGVRGLDGDLLLEPKLTKDEFDENGNASLTLMFAGREVTVNYTNFEHLESNAYSVLHAEMDGEELPISDPKFVRISRSELLEHADQKIQISVILG